MPYLIDWFIIARIAARAAETTGPYDIDVKAEVKRYVTLSAIEYSEDVYDFAALMVAFEVDVSVVRLCDMVS